MTPEEDVAQIRGVIQRLVGPEIQDMTHDEAMSLAHQLVDEADVSVLEGDVRGPEARAEVTTEEEKRLIELDATAAAKNGFPQLRISPSADYGAGISECRELLLKLCEATAR
eukprot:11951411-Alexandrium_andersonii.AAC.1